jgi:hypothetical protein
VIRRPQATAQPFLRLRVPVFLFIFLLRYKGSHCAVVYLSYGRSLRISCRVDLLKALISGNQRAETFRGYDMEAAIGDS